jgi:hypothetical protein
MGGRAKEGDNRCRARFALKSIKNLGSWQKKIKNKIFRKSKRNLGFWGTAATACHTGKIDLRQSS